MAAFPTVRLSRLVLVGALGFVLSGAVGCVSMDEHKRLRVAFEQSQRDLAEAQSDLANARKRITDLEAEIAKLNDLINGSQGGIGALKRERDLLAQKLAQLQKAYEDLLAKGGGVELPPPLLNLLRDLAAQYPDLLEFDENLGMIRFKSDMTFDLGSTEVKPGAREALKKLTAILNNPMITSNEIRVVGHTDDVPIRARAGSLNPDNWYLSTNRAHAILNVLRADGLSESRGQAAGWGEQRPIAPNAPGKRGSEKNRRVDIYILPTTVPQGITISTPGAARPAPAPVRRPAPVTTRPAPAAPVAPAPAPDSTPLPVPGM